jgi:predicted HAD superfamily Cof-like phosphohydrolase
MEQEVQMSEDLVMVTEFIRVFKASFDLRLWAKLIKEELHEYRVASMSDDREEMLKEIADVIYVRTGFLAVLGGGIHEGILQKGEFEDWVKMSDEVSAVVEEALGFFDEATIIEAFRRVHASNMSKLGDDGKPILREDGKVLKGPNYKKPYLTDLLEGTTIRVEKTA